jgi:hypothetical protein
MKNNCTKILLLSTILSSLFYAESNAATGNASATVVTAIAVSETTAMQFGLFSASGSTGTINQAGTATGGVTAIASGVTRSAGIFAVTGTGNASYTFTLPSTATLTRSGESETMTADLSFNSGNGTRSLTSGSENVTINGSLTVAANQIAGVYNGTYTVTVAYN